ncbi:hypothetical protein QM325_25325, partial [Pseudomonas putida]|nr:hypothetical protein [Pseudomonas putida]
MTNASRGIATQDKTEECFIGSGQHSTNHPPPGKFMNLPGGGWLVECCPEPMKHSSVLSWVAIPLLALVMLAWREATRPDLVE